MRSAWFRTLLITALLTGLAGPMPAAGAARQPGAPAQPAVRQLIVKLTGPAPASVDALTLGPLSAAAGVALSYVRSMLTGAQVLRLPQAVPAAEAQRIAARLAAQPGVAYAVPDYVRYPLYLPTDPGVASQWNWTDPAGGVNAPAAWDLITDTTSVVVAIIDTGILTDHADLPAGRLLPGYDFITSLFTANDGGGRDSDARDPGDWVTQTDIDTQIDCAMYSQPRNSSWHGTSVAGLVAAQGNNGQGIAGLAWGGAQILPVRVLGKCGGTDSDIADGMLWAAGVTGPGLPANPHPAKILNLSLGGPPVDCAFTAYASAVQEVLAAGAIVIAAAGNDFGAVNTPANCPGVIAVAANDRAGSLSDFGGGAGSSHGPEIALSAPGGKASGGIGIDIIWSTSNSGTQGPAANSTTIKGSVGTSDAAPEAAGAAALVWAANPDLTGAQVSAILTTTARAFPAGSTCLTTYANECGTGILDAGAAVDAARPTLTALNPVSATAGSPDLTLTVTGQNFAHGAEVRWDGAALATTFGNTGLLTATVPAAYLTAAGAAAVTVANPAIGLGPALVSPAGLTFTIDPAAATPTPPTVTPGTPIPPTVTPGTPTPAPHMLFMPAIQRGP